MKRWVPLVLLVVAAIWWSTTGIEWGETPSRPDEPGVATEKGRSEPAPEAADGSLPDPTKEPETAAPETAWVPDPNGRPIAGWVVDENGTPIAGAVVRFGARSWMREDPREFPAATTGVDGGFRLDGLPGGLYYLEVGAALHASDSVDQISAGRTDVRITLKRAGQIAVRLVLPKGTTPPDPVRVQTKVERRNETTGDWKLASLEFTEDLSFHVDGLPAGRYRLTVRMIGVGLGTANAVEVREGETTPVAVSPTGGATLIGRVVSDLDGKPIEGAFVVAGQLGWVPAILLIDNAPTAFASLAVPARTDAEGRFRIPGLLPGLHAVAARAEGLQPVADESVTIPRKEELVLRLAHGGTLEVLVLDRFGKPVKEAEVSAEFGEDGFGSAETDARGLCRLPVMPPGHAWLTAETSKWTVAGPATVVAGPATRVTLRHPNGAANLAGSLTRGGRPVIDRILSFESERGDGSWFSLDTQTGPAGKYRIEGIPIGAIELIVNDLRHLPILERTADVRPGENTLDIELPTGILRLRVLEDVTDKPLLLANIAFESGRMTWTDGEGRVTVEDLEEGEHPIEVQRSGYTGKKLKVATTGDAGEVIIRLTPAPK